MAAQLNVDFAVFRLLSRESGSDHQSQPNPLGLSPIATSTYLRNGRRQTHCTYIPYFQQFNHEKGLVFGTKIVAPLCSSGLQQNSRRCNRYIVRRRLGRALEQSRNVLWNQRQNACGWQRAEESTVHSSQYKNRGAHKKIPVHNPGEMSPVLNVPARWKIAFENNRAATASHKAGAN